MKKKIKKKKSIRVGREDGGSSAESNQTIGLPVEFNSGAPRGGSETPVPSRFTMRGKVN